MDFSVVRTAFYDELTKIAAELSEASRDKITPKNFALTPKQSDTGKPAYPIEDKPHASNALARVKQFGSPAQRSEVYDDVAKKFPGLASKSSVPALRGKEKDADMGSGVLPSSTNGAAPLPKTFGAPSVQGSMQGMMGKTGAPGDLARFMSGVKSEGGPALGATLGAGLVKMKGGDPLSGAALGYGIGSLPEMLAHKLKARGAPAGHQ